MTESSPVTSLDPETAELALRLARVIGPMRATSKFALRTFLEAVEQDMNGAELTISWGSPPEAGVRIDPRRSE